MNSQNVLSDELRFIILKIILRSNRLMDKGGETLAAGVCHDFL